MIAHSVTLKYIKLIHRWDRRVVLACTKSTNSAGFAFLKHKTVPVSYEIKVFNTLIKPILLYGSEV